MDGQRAVPSLAFLVQQKAGPGSFFREKDSKVLMKTKVMKGICEALSEAGMDRSHISSYSFQIGAATAAAQGSASKEDIKALGRWKSREYRGYIRRDEGVQASLAMDQAVYTCMCTSRVILVCAENSNMLATLMASMLMERGFLLRQPGSEQWGLSEWHVLGVVAW